MASQSESQVYEGEEKIVLAIDLGTTHSAVSFTHAYPGSDIDVRMHALGNEVERTTRSGWGLEGSYEFIPTILAYEDGELVACGAEAREYMGDDRYQISKWFKLHLHPDTMKISDEPPSYDSDETTPSTMEIPPLPTGVTLTKVYSDFMAYLYTGFRTFFEETTPNGVAIWERLSSNAVI
ncbi:hypothetical protein FRC17_011310, partial [Serendipita sp. 399]